MRTNTWTRDRLAALRGRSGSMREMIFSAVILLILATAAGATIRTAAPILNATGSQAERRAAVTALVADKRATVKWGTAASPLTLDYTLPSGLHTPIRLWTVPATGGVRYEALVAKNRTAASSICASTMASDSSACIHAELFRAYDATTLVPTPIVRKDPSLTTAIGAVDPAVGAGIPLPTGATVAASSSATPRAWRYLINAATTRSTGEIRFLQGGKTLATIPLSSTPTDYFGTIAVAGTTPVTATVSDGPVIVTTVLIYDAGAAS